MSAPASAHAEIAERIETVTDAQWDALGAALARLLYSAYQRRIAGHETAEPVEGSAVAKGAR